VTIVPVLVAHPSGLPRSACAYRMSEPVVNADRQIRDVIQKPTADQQLRRFTNQFVVRGGALERNRINIDVTNACGNSREASHDARAKTVAHLLGQLRATPRLRMVSRASGPRLEGAPESRPLEIKAKTSA
jgi:hypothetical protein